MTSCFLSQMRKNSATLSGLYDNRFESVFRPNQEIRDVNFSTENF